MTKSPHDGPAWVGALDEAALDYVDGVEPPTDTEALAWGGQATGTEIALVGCHGGAGIDTLAALIGGTAPVGRVWPVPSAGGSVAVVLVARETLAGLEAAHIALRQWMTGGTPDGTILLGLVLVPGSRGKVTPAVAVKRRLVAGLAPMVSQMSVQWHEELLSLSLADLPRLDPFTDPGAELPKRYPKSLIPGGGVTRDVAELAYSLADLAADGGEDDAGWQSSDESRELPVLPPLPDHWAHTEDDDADHGHAAPLLAPAVAAVDEVPPPSSPHVPRAAEADDAQPPYRDRLGALRDRLGKPRAAMIAVIAAAAVMVVLAGLALVKTIGEVAPNDRPSMEGLTSAATVAAADSCIDRSDGAVTVGNGPGDRRGSGPDVIKAWNHAYYTTRDAVAAKAVTAEGAVSATDSLQKAIDAVPQGTAHCLSITDLGAGRYAVALTVMEPNEPPRVLQQVIDTATSGGQTWITAIRKAP